MIRLLLIDFLRIFCYGRIQKWSRFEQYTARIDIFGILKQCQILTIEKRKFSKHVRRDEDIKKKVWFMRFRSGALLVPPANIIF
jgi:hypothetical protein